MDFGKKHLNRFEPFPKNPAISKIFREIGYADELGSGMRNTYKYTKLYSGGTPIFIEDNIFEIIIPMENAAPLQVGPEDVRKITGETETSFETSLKQVLKQSDYMKLESIINWLARNEQIRIQEVMEITNKSRATAWRYMQKLLECGAVEVTGSTNNIIYRRKY